MPDGVGVHEFILPAPLLLGEHSSECFRDHIKVEVELLLADIRYRTLHSSTKVAKIYKDVVEQPSVRNEVKAPKHVVVQSMGKARRKF